MINTAKRVTVILFLFLVLPLSVCGASDLDGLDELSVGQGALDLLLLREDSVLGNLARVSQVGDFNQAEVTQSGLYNQAILMQEGNANTALVQQLGDSNYAAISQSGAYNQATAIQGGINNVALISQIGYGNSANIIQNGDGLFGFVAQFGDDHTVQLVQYD
ncbi:hypothetical protein ACJJIF_19340 [Microbulbifer sp. SSSA002]|uniref:hypothetical protein n=1 Tax=unclassified Microbulbifer TaxID=2619833 RepID=UPI00403A3D4D